MVLATRHGVNLSGLNPGALVFIQMYRSLAGLESAMDVISTSSAYASLINDQKVQPYVRNIAKAVNQRALHKRQNRSCGNLYDRTGHVIMLCTTQPVMYYSVVHLL